ncbi:MAG: molybdopterin-dependent oxidoreductase [Nitrospirae bacterium]|nr:molybdopterin-dependent oxidoreductase [Nitrospirota bacterium]
MLEKLRLKRRAFIKYAALLLGGGAIFAYFRKALDFLWPAEDAYVSKDLRDVSAETQELYRSEFIYTRGDSTGYSPHCVNCKGNCAWQTFEKEGRVVREEQVSSYPQISPDIPDANPRGCNKGALHSQSLYEKDRILYPMKRTGARGEGKWKRIGWDEAAEEIAEKIAELEGKKEFNKLMVWRNHCLRHLHSRLLLRGMV